MAEEQEGQRGSRVYIGQLAGLWKSLSFPARLGAIAVIVIIVVLIAFTFTGYFSPLEMSVLFSNMEPYQAQEVVAQLEEMNIPFQVADGGTKILVPQDQRDKLRLTLSPVLYAQGKGFALFENSGLMVSDFEQRVQLQMALEEELRRTITSIDAVEQARVHLVIPEKSAFVREHGSPSASIFLRLKPLAVLSEDQVRGILGLVAGSVEGLQPEQVTIVDSRGNILHDAFSALDQGGASSVDYQLRLKRTFERELESRLKHLLEQVYGPGKAVAMVSVELDFSNWEKTTVSYDNPVSRSEQNLEERYTGTGVSEEVGDSNIPGYAAPVEPGEYSHEKIEEIINYEVGETREYMSSAPGKIEKLSAAVIIDNSLQSDNLSEQVSSLVASAIGFNSERGDSIVVQTAAFESPWQIGDEQPEPPPESTVGPLPTYIAAACIALLVVAAAFLLFRKSRASVRGQPEPEPVFTKAEEGERSEVVSEKLPAKDLKQEKLRKLAEEEPESVAQVLKTWLAGE